MKNIRSGTRYEFRGSILWEGRTARKSPTCTNRYLYYIVGGKPIESWREKDIGGWDKTNKRKKNKTKLKKSTPNMIDPVKLVFKK